MSTTPPSSPTPPAQPAPAPRSSVPATTAPGLPRKTHGVRWASLARSPLEDAFFLFTTVFCFWSAWQILVGSTGWGWRIVGTIIAWAFLAYLAMPRLNQLLTSIYVPDYYIGRTRAGDGVLGDPVNLAFLGSEDQVRTAMKDAGWSMAEPITVRSSLRIIRSSLTGKSYDTAPVSPLYLFGRQEDFAFEQEVDGNARQRHHVRFFRVPDNWLLPGGHRVDWLASGSYDKKVGLSLFTGQVTHKIDADIDQERDHIVHTLTTALPGTQVDLLRDYSTSFRSRNGGGDVVRTDGALPIVDLEGVDAEPQPPLRRPVSLTDVASRPTAVVVAVVLTVLSVLVSVVVEAITDPHLTAGTAAAMVVVAAVMLLLAAGTYRGWQWARIGLLAITAVALVGHYRVHDEGYGRLLDLAVNLTVMYTLTSEQVRAWRGESPRG